MRLSLPKPRLTPEMRDMLRRLWPGLLGSGATQLNLTVDTLISTLLPAGSISWLYFADRVNQLPLGVLGAAAGTTLLPVLTRHAAARDDAGGQQTLNRAIDYAAILTFPACFGLLALAPEIMATLFGYGKFTTEDALSSAQSLRAYALGLPAFILIKVLSPGFFAHGDTRTPVRIGFFTIVLNLALNLLLYRSLAHIAPPLASTLAAMVNLAFLAIILHKRAVFRPNRDVMRRMIRIIAASFLMAVVTLTLTRLVAPGLVMWHGLIRAAMLGILMGVAGIVYLALLRAFGIAHPERLMGRLLRRKQPQDR